MKTRLIKICCKRCGKEIHTTNAALMQKRPSFRDYGNICSACLSSHECLNLSKQQILENYYASKKYIIIKKVNWNSEEFDQNEKSILQFMANRIFYTGTPPSLLDAMNEFHFMDVTIVLQNLEKKGFVKALI